MSESVLDASGTPPPLDPADSAPAAFKRPAPRINGARVLIALFGAMLVSAIVVAVGLAAGVRGGDVACLIWAALAITVSAVPLALDFGRPLEHRHLFLSMFAIAYTVNFVVPVLTLYIPAVGPMDPGAMSGSNLLPRDIALGQSIALAGLVCFYAGYALPLRTVLRPQLPKMGREWSQYPALVVIFLLTIFGWTIFGAGSAGLIPRSAGTGWTAGIASLTVTASALLTATYLRYRSRAAWVLLIILVPATTIINFTTGSKTAVLLPATMVVMTWVIVHKRIRARWIAAGFVALILLYPVAHFWRNDILQENTLTMANVVADPGPAVERTAAFLSSARGGEYLAQGLDATGRRLDAIGICSVIIRDTPSVSPFQNGRTLALIPISFVPRILWPGKPVIPIGRWITETYTIHGYKSESSLAATWIGEFYLNFGFPGVVGGMLFMGALLRFLHEILMRSNPSIPMIAVSAILITTLMMGIQEAVARSIMQPTIMLLPLLFTHGAVRLAGATRPIDLNERHPA